MRPQLTILFEKQISTSEGKSSISGVHLILRCHKIDDKYLASDGFNSIEIHIRKKRKHRKNKILKSSENEMKNNYLYTFAFCQIQFHTKQERIKLILESKGFGLLVPNVGDREYEVPILLEEDLDESEVEQIKRKVSS